MSKQTINIGASPNDGTGTPLRTSFDYTNQNFTELYTALGGGVGLPGATTQVIFNDGGTNLAGDAGLVYNKTTDALTVAGLVTAGSASITGAATVGTTLGVTGVSTLASATITGAATVGTTLAVTGNLTAAADSILGTGSKATDTLLDFKADTGTQRIYLDRGGRNLIFKDVTTNIENYRITGVTGVQTWGVGGSTAMTLDSAGLGLGESPVTGQKLTVNGSASVRNGNKLYIWDTGNSTAHAIYNSGDNLTFTKNNGTTSMLLDALGNLILLSPSTPPTLSTNGQLTVNATSNTNLRFSYRGSDGTTRVANITLA